MAKTCAFLDHKDTLAAIAARHRGGHRERAHRGGWPIVFEHARQLGAEGIVFKQGSGRHHGAAEAKRELEQA
jgi:hypothetical protein